MAETNPGQQNLAYDAATNQPRLSVDVTYDENTPLEDIPQKYTDISNQYNSFVEDARQNVADRQTERIGNNFGASPYNTNTYYEQGATSFASAMRQVGTQQALTVGMERGKKEAENALEAAKKNYENAATAYQEAYDNFKKNPVAATIDEETLREHGMTKEDFADLIQSSGDINEVMNKIVPKMGMEADIKDWNVEWYRNLATEMTLYHYGKDKAWLDGLSDEERDEWWQRADVGRYWSDQYIKNYLINEQGSDFYSAWEYNYNEYKGVVDGLVKYFNGESEWSDDIFKTLTQPQGVDGYEYTLLDVLISEDLNPEFVKGADDRVKFETSGENVTGFIVDGESISVAELEGKMKDYYGNDYSLKESWNAVQSNFSGDKDKRTKVKEDILRIFGRGKAHLEIGAVSPNDLTQAMFGVDVQTLKNYMTFQNEDPEKFEMIKDSVTRSLTDISIFEVADGEKQFYTADGWKVLDAGTVVTHVPQAVLDDEGSPIDPALQKVISLFREEDDPTVSEEQRVKLMQEYAAEYATNLAIARQLTNGGSGSSETIDQNIYRSILAARGQINSDVQVLNGKSKEDIINEFERMRKENAGEAYQYFADLMRNAYKGMGGFLTKENGQLTVAGLDDKNGQSNLGYHGQEFTDRDQSDSMAELIILMSSIDAYNNGSKDGNVDPSFLDQENDGAGWLGTTMSKLWRNVAGDIDGVTGMVGMTINWIADGLTGGKIAQKNSKDVDNYLGILASNSGVLGLTGAKNMDELVSGELVEGRLGYDVEVNNRNGDLIRNAVNPLTYALWNIDAEGHDIGDASVMKERNGWDDVRDFASDTVAFAGGEALEALATAGIATAIKKGGTAAKAAMKAGVKGAADKLVASSWRQSIKDFAKDVGKAIVTDAADITDEMADAAAHKAAKEVAQEGAEAVAKGAAKEVAKSSSDDVLKAARRALQNKTDDVVKTLSYMANKVDDFGDAGKAFAKRAMQGMTDDYVKKILVDNGAKRVTKASIESFKKNAYNYLVELGANASRETYQTALTSIFTGSSTKVVTEASSDVVTFVSKMIGSGLESTSGGFKRMMTGRNMMSIDDVKRGFSKVLEMSASAQRLGKSFGVQDAVRFLAGEGWESKRLALIASNIAKDFAQDAAHDIVRGYTMPSIDSEGNAVRTSVEEYFSNPMNFVTPATLTTVRLGVGAGVRRLQASHLRKGIEKTQRAMAATANSTPEYAQLAKKLQGQVLKSQKLAAKMFDKSLSYDQMRAVSKAGEEIEQKYQKEFFERLGTFKQDIDKYNNLAERARKRGNYKDEAEWLSKSARLEDELAAAQSIVGSYGLRNSMDIFNRLGNGKAGTLSALTDNNTWLKINEIADETAVKMTKSINDDVRLKTKTAKQAAMRKLQVDAVVDALRAPDGSLPVTNLREGLTELFKTYDSVAAQLVADGILPESKIKLGYMSEAGMRIGTAGDDVPWFAKGIFLGSDSGSSIALDSPDPIKSREIPYSEFLKAIKRGDDTVKYSYTDAKGKTVTLESKVNKDGVNMMHSLIAYCNSNMVHRYDGALLGGGGMDMGSASLRNSKALIFGKGNAQRAAAADVEVLGKEILSMQQAARAKLDEYNAPKIKQIQNKAKTKLKQLANSGAPEVVELENANQRLNQAKANLQSARAQLADGSRPAGALSFSDIFDSEFTDSKGRVHKLDLSDSQYTDVNGNKLDLKSNYGGSAREKAIANVKKDILDVQAGKTIGVTDYMYLSMIDDAARNNGAFTYDAVVYRAMIDNPQFIKRDSKFEFDLGQSGRQLSLDEPNLDKVGKKMSEQEMAKTIGVNYSKYKYNGKEYDLKNLSIDNPKQAEVIWDFYKTNLEAKAPRTKKGEVPAAYSRMITDAISTTKTQLAEMIGPNEVPIGIRGVYEQLIKNLPDKEKFDFAYESGLITLASSITNDGIEIAEWRSGIANMVHEAMFAPNDAPVKGSTLYERGRALALVDEIAQGGQRYAGTGGFDTNLEYGDEIGLYGTSPDVLAYGASEDVVANNVTSTNSGNMLIKRNGPNAGTKANTMKLGIDMNNDDQVKEAISCLVKVTKEMQENNQLHKYRTEIDGYTKSARRSLAESAANLYKSGTSDEYNQLVNAVARDRLSREIDSGKFEKYNKAVANKFDAKERAKIRQGFLDNVKPKDNDYLAALGIARPDSVLGRGKNLSSFNAAETAMQKGKPNQFYSSAVTKSNSTGRRISPADISNLLHEQYTSKFFSSTSFNLDGYEDALNLYAASIDGRVSQFANAVNMLEQFGGSVDASASADIKSAQVLSGVGGFTYSSGVGMNTPETALYQLLASGENNKFFSNGGPQIIDKPTAGLKEHASKVRSAINRETADQVEVTLGGKTQKFSIERSGIGLGDERMVYDVEPIARLDNGDIYLIDKNGKRYGAEKFMEISERDEKGADAILSKIEEIKKRASESAQDSEFSVGYADAAEAAMAENAELNRLYDSIEKARESYFNNNTDVDFDEVWQRSREYAYNKYIADSSKRGAPSAETMKKQVADFEAEVKKLEKEISSIESRRASMDAEQKATEASIKKQYATSIKKLKEDADGWKHVMDKDTYAKYQQLTELRNKAKAVAKGEGEIYHSSNGVTYVLDGARFQNYVTLEDAMKQYGMTPDAKVGENGLVDIKMPEENAKKMKKELKKGNLQNRGNYFKRAADNPVARTADVDTKTAQLTLAHLQNFYKQVVKAAGNGDSIDSSNIWVDSSLVDLMVRYGDSPLDPGRAAQVASKIAKPAQWLQNFQLNGGGANVNALTLGYLRTAMLQDPRKIPQLVKSFLDCRNNKTWMASIQSRIPELEMFAMEFGDPSVIMDLMPAFSHVDGVDDTTLQGLASKILDRLDGETRKNGNLPKGFLKNADSFLSGFFEDPTFQRTLPVMRAQMLMTNYDSALSKMKKKFAKDIGNGISAEDIQKAAMTAAYAKTMRFWCPEKFFELNYKEGLQKIHNQQVRRMVGNITGEGTPTTVLDLAKNAFFALSYKQSYVNTVGQGFFETVATPFRGLYNKATNKTAKDALESATESIANSGVRQGFLTMAGLAVAAKLWCDVMAIPNAWDDFTFEPQDGDEKFHMPSVLMKMQNIGQIWLPNDVDENGMPTVNPDKEAHKIDPFFSMFTLPNTAFKSIDRFFNGDTNRYPAPQGGLGFVSNMFGADWYGANKFFNSQQVRAVTDELIGANLLSPFKAFYEVLTNSTYFGNNIWERKYLPDGSENKNYDPQRNITASIMHIWGLDEVLDPNGYNRWVKGADVSNNWFGKALGGDGSTYVKQDQVGTIKGSGILQHEFITAARALVDGDLAAALIEGGELPIKSEKLSSKARTELNNTVKNTLAHLGDEYRSKIAQANSVDKKDQIFAEYCQKSADVVAKWSKKYDYILGENQNLVASATRLLMAMTAGEYDDRLAYVQNAYWKAATIAQIEASDAGSYWLNDADVEAMANSGMSAEEIAAEKNKRTIAYNQALDDEYDAREALKRANVPEEWFTKYAYEDLKAESRRISAKIYNGITSQLDKPVGEFANFKEMKQYYENQIEATTDKKTKAKIANQYNKYVFDIIAPYVEEYGASVLTDATYNSKGISQQISDYIIIPADKYYTGKSPKTSYLRDWFGVGYRDRRNMPSDDEISEKFSRASKLLNSGKMASASSVIDGLVKNIKSGKLYASNIDYSKIIRLQSKLRSKR